VSDDDATRILARMSVTSRACRDRRGLWPTNQVKLKFHEENSPVEFKLISTMIEL